jgi:thiol-disulfide isomerase/thioredoxin
MKTPLLCVCLCLIGATAALAEVRTWTNASGKTLQAEFVRTDGDNIILRAAGREYPVPRAQLSAADLEYVAKAPAPAATTTPPPTKPAFGAASKEDRKAKWLTKMSKAKEEATETGLPVLVLFTGTSWCHYCIKLEEQVFAEKSFKEMANKKLVLLKFDFPAGGGGSREEEALQKEYGVTGFPRYFLVGADGKRLAEGGYNSSISPESFEAWVDKSAKK